MKLEAMSRQGHRSDLTSDQLGRKLETAEIIAQQSDDSKSQVRRYIRLTYLIPEFLERMDKGEIALSVGVELSFRHLQLSLPSVFLCIGIAFPALISPPMIFLCCTPRSCSVGALSLCGLVASLRPERPGCGGRYSLFKVPKITVDISALMG